MAWSGYKALEQPHDSLARVAAKGARTGGADAKGGRRMWLMVALAKAAWGMRRIRPPGRSRALG